MKKGILIDATYDGYWIGGLYYKKNIIYSMLQNPDFMDRYKIVVIISPEHLGLFSCFGSNIKIYVLKDNAKRKKLKLLLLAVLNNCRYWFPYSGKDYFKKLGGKEIFWFADFQHCHYPQFFSESEIKKRAEFANRIINNKELLVLSSLDSYSDLSMYYGENDRVCIFHFVSYIENEILSITDIMENSVLEKYGLNKRNYFCISNQFWQHKNHIVVLKAIKKICSNNPSNEYMFAFTGKVSDYRNPEYIDKIKYMIEDDEIKDHIKMLGFMERLEQLIIIKNAKAVIQPSLFEGWGTVLEDVKVLDQTVILSDIPVHREQMNEKCFLFDPNNVDDLVNVINKVNIMKKTQDIEKGIEDMRERAKQYSQPFLEFLNKL